MQILIVYATTEGQTRKIAEQIGEWVRALRHNICILDCALVNEETKVDGFDGYILAGSLHNQKHQASLARFVRRYRAVLQRSPTAFISVSASAARTDAGSLAAAKQCIDHFIQQTGWTPTVSMPVGGAIKYTQYNFLLRFVMKKISEVNGGPTDTSQDYEFTDWTALQSFVDQFLARYVERKADVGPAPASKAIA